MRTCARCHCEIHLNPDPDCPPDWVKRLSGLDWCCNRCADWGQARNKLAEAIVRQCGRIVFIRRKPLEEEKNRELLDRIRKWLSMLTKRYAQNTCTYYRVAYSENPVTGTWLPDFVDQLVECCDRAEAVLRAYERQIEHLKP